MKKITLITFCAAATLMTAIGLTQKPGTTANALLAANVEALSQAESANGKVTQLGDGKVLIEDAHNEVIKNKVKNTCVGNVGDICYIDTNLNPNAHTTLPEIMNNSIWDKFISAMGKLAHLLAGLLSGL